MSYIHSSLYKKKLNVAMWQCGNVWRRKIYILIIKQSAIVRWAVKRDILNFCGVFACPIERRCVGFLAPINYASGNPARTSTMI